MSDMMPAGPLRIVTGPETEEDREIAARCECPAEVLEDISKVGKHKIPKGVTSLIHKPVK